MVHEKTDEQKKKMALLTNRNSLSKNLISVGGSVTWDTGLGLTMRMVSMVSVIHCLSRLSSQILAGQFDDPAVLQLSGWEDEEGETLPHRMARKTNQAIRRALNSAADVVNELGARPDEEEDEGLLRPTWQALTSGVAGALHTVAEKVPSMEPQEEEAEEGQEKVPPARV